jgi:hypothetical protein
MLTLTDSLILGSWVGQVSLGDLNDIVVNKRLIASFVSSPATHDPPAGQAWKAFTAGRLCRREEARFASVMKAATHAHKVFGGRETILELTIAPVIC